MEKSKQLAQMSAPAASSIKLLQCLTELEGPARQEAKMELVLRCGELMPAGQPDFLGMRKYPAISVLVQGHGRKKMLAILVLLVKDFCSSINVVRNMNEDQMIEAGAMLLEECGNFRMEDYLLMFAMAKRGQLGRIMDRIDIERITGFMDEYWQRRSIAGQMALEEEVRQIEGDGENMRGDFVWNGKTYSPAKTVGDGLESLAGAIGNLKIQLNDKGLDKPLNENEQPN